MRTLAFLCAGTVLTLALISSRPAAAQSLYQFNTGDALIINPPPVPLPDPYTNPDDGYDPNVVVIQSNPNVTGPANGSALFAGASTLAGSDYINQTPGRFFNSEFPGFSLTSPNGAAPAAGDTIHSTGLDADEFNSGYLTWTVAAKPGQKLNLSSLSFDSIRGGSSRRRGFQIFAATNSNPFTYGNGSLLYVFNEDATASRGTTGFAPKARSIDLSDSTYQGVDSITFRYYPLTETNINSIEFANMSVNGTVVPEPTALALLGLGAAGCLVRRRRGA
jgi:hypothetical protein